MLPPDDMAAVPAPADAAAQPDRAAVGRRFQLFWWVSLATVAIDQLTKALIDAYIPLYDSHTVVSGFMDIVHVRNAGVAFGLLNSFEHPGRSLVTTGLAVVALAGIAYYARNVRPEEWLARVGLSLILGGALGNLVDRIRQGFVIDFVDVYWRGWHFWAFNVADAAISVGAALIFVEILFMNRHASHSV